MNNLLLCVSQSFSKKKKKKKTQNFVSVFSADIKKSFVLGDSLFIPFQF